MICEITWTKYTIIFMEYYHHNGDRWNVGVYGGYYVVDYIHNKWGITHVWQTKSWSDGKVYAYNDIYQYEHDVENYAGISGLTVDKNSSPGNTGGFRI